MATTTSFKFSTKSFDGSTTSGSVGGLGGGTSLPQNVAYTNVDNLFSVAQTFSADVTVGANIGWTGVATGNGSSITDLSASALASGTINDARLSSNVALKNTDNSFSVGQTFNQKVGIGGANTSQGLLTVDMDAFGDSISDGFAVVNNTLSLRLYVTDVGRRHITAGVYSAIDFDTDDINFSLDTSFSNPVTFADTVTFSSTGVFTGSVTASSFIGSGSSLTSVNASQLGGVDAVNYMRLDDNAGTPRVLDMNNSINFGLGGTPLKSLTGNTEIDIIGKVESDGNVVSGGNILASSGYFKSDAPTGNSGTLIDGGVASPTAENIKFGSVHGISTVTYGWSGRVIVMEVDGVSYSVMTADDDTPIT